MIFCSLVRIIYPNRSAIYMNDRQLKEDFLRMIRENKGLIFKVCNFYAATPEDFRDIEQEILIQLWIAFPNYDDTFKYSTWIYRIALNTAISFQRKESRHRYTIGYDGAIFQIPDSVATDPELKLQIKQLYAAIDNLNNIDKAILLLYLEGNSYKEIAEIIGTSETNIGTKINRLKQKMKNTIN